MDENETQNAETSQVEEESTIKKHLFSVTPLSKYLAMVLFIILPFVGLWWGLNMGVDLDSFKKTNEVITTNETSNQQPPLLNKGIYVNPEELFIIESDDFLIIPDFSEIHRGVTFSNQQSDSVLYFPASIGHTNFNIEENNFVYYPGPSISRLLDTKDSTGFFLSNDLPRNIAGYDRYLYSFNAEDGYTKETLANRYDFGSMFYDKETGNFWHATFDKVLVYKGNKRTDDITWTTFNYSNTESPGFIYVGSNKEYNYVVYSGNSNYDIKGGILIRQRTKNDWHDIQEKLYNFLCKDKSNCKVRPDINSGFALNDEFLWLKYVVVSDEGTEFLILQVSSDGENMAKVTLTRDQAYLLNFISDNQPIFTTTESVPYEISKQVGTYKKTIYKVQGSDVITIFEMPTGARGPSPLTVTSDNDVYYLNGSELVKYDFTSKLTETVSKIPNDLLLFGGVSRLLSVDAPSDSVLVFTEVSDSWRWGYEGYGPPGSFGIFNLSQLRFDAIESTEYLLTPQDTVFYDGAFFIHKKYFGDESVRAHTEYVYRLSPTNKKLVNVTPEDTDGLFSLYVADDNLFLSSAKTSYKWDSAISEFVETDFNISDIISQVINRDPDKGTERDPLEHYFNLQFEDSIKSELLTKLDLYFYEEFKSTSLAQSIKEMTESYREKSRNGRAVGDNALRALYTDNYTVVESDGTILIWGEK
jgi:hypothetical protein